MPTNLSRWITAAVVAFGSTQLLAPPPATAAEGDKVAPTVVSPVDGSEVSYGFTGPLVIDYTTATPGTWQVEVSCQTDVVTYSWQTYTDHNGTVPIREYTLPEPVDAAPGWSCTASVSDAAVGQAATVWDVNTFTVAQPPVEVRWLDQSPSVFYPRVRDGYRDTSTTRYSLNRSATVKAKVRDDAGDKLRTVRLGEQSAGNRQWTWDGRTDSGTKARKGDYTIEIVAKDVDRHKDRFTTDVRVATKRVTRTDRITVGGGSGARRASRSCFATRYDGVMTLDCWGGRYAQASYRFDVPKSAYQLDWRAAGQAPAADICCQGRITKSGTRTRTREYVVRVRVTGWRAYEVHAVRLDYKYKVRF